jgi:hypothetical protein
MGRYLRSFVLSAALLGPITLAPIPLKAEPPHRYYDREHKDWHEWNEREDRAYRHYLEERHERYREWAKAKRAEQRAYWRWRHEHSDAVLFR